MLEAAGYGRSRRYADVALSHELRSEGQLMRNVSENKMPRGLAIPGSYDHVTLKAPARRAQNASPIKGSGVIQVGHQQVGVGTKFDRAMKKVSSKSQHHLSGREEAAADKTANISQQIHHRAHEIGGRERINVDQVSTRTRS